MGFEQEKRQIDFDKSSHWKINKKSRPIRYASHYDAAIFSHYAEKLELHYENYLKEHALENSVLAYRGGVGSNINAAKDLFDEVRSRGECQVICFDISKFFDRIDHKRLIQRVGNMIGGPLKKDWKKVLLRSMRFDHVDSKLAKKLVPKSLAQGRICSSVQFRKFIKPSVQTNLQLFGIPQGLPISGILANVYLSQFDKKMADYIRKIGGSYRRYSDDIAVTLNSGQNKEPIIIAINTLLLSEFLLINESKTTYTKFTSTALGQNAYGDDLQYLGFNFDGRRILIRSSSLKRYYSKMKAAIRIAVRAAVKAGYPANQIRRRTLTGKYTHWGDRRNFIQYVYRASILSNSPAIRKQVARHTVIFNTYFRDCISKYY